MGVKTNWTGKLRAYLHDPPEKAYDFGEYHHEQARKHQGALGLSGGNHGTVTSDWDASAADRADFPIASALSVKLNESVFRHPCSGEPLRFEFPSQVDTEEFISAVLPSFQGDEQTRFWLAWRLWREYAATHSAGQGKGAGTLAYLPAETRLPDHTIWHHMAVTSAMEGTRGEDGKLHPAFLLFQLGPVQEFIAQAQSTRDLWSGSYLVSWLMAHAINKVVEDCGPDAVIFPSVCGQPLMDFLNQDKLKQARYPGSKNYWEVSRSDAHILTPNLPNRFLAVVPAGYDLCRIGESLRREWMDIAQACLDILDNKDHTLGEKQRKRWDFQVARQWQTTWQMWPWQDVERTTGLLGEFAGETKETLKTRLKVAEKFRSGVKLNLGFAWAGHYQLCANRLDARRQTRDFAAWQTGEVVDKAVKDCLSGREETVLDTTYGNEEDTWFKRAEKDALIGPLFRKGADHLGAVNAIKRVWHVAYLERKHGIKRGSVTFDSVPAVAAAPWLASAKAKNPDTAAFWSAVKACESELPFEISSSALPSSVFDLDASAFHTNEWEKWKIDAPEVMRTRFDNAIKALADLHENVVAKPSKYYAVLALDGDQMGKWISGEKTPTMKSVLADGSARYFEDKFGDKELGKNWLACHRPISPSYHLQFSEALSNFALYCTGRIVERHHGQLIYAGGDDVLAMLPADEVIACAQGLNMAFQGRPELVRTYPTLFRTPSSVPVGTSGLVQLANPRRGEPCWPLLVPGPTATVSVGIAIGHIKEPLQDMVHAAQKAEKRAKGDLDRNALAVNLFKRSGEAVEWGCKFDSKAFDLFELIKEPVISGKFPYRIAELLRKFGPETKTSQVLDIALKEFEWAVGQMSLAETGDRLVDRGKLYMKELANIVRKTEDGNTEPAPRPLKDFYNLFAVEAFISRQGE